PSDTCGASFGSIQHLTLACQVPTSGSSSLCSGPGWPNFSKYCWKSCFCEPGLSSADTTATQTSVSASDTSNADRFMGYLRNGEEMDAPGTSRAPVTQGANQMPVKSPWRRHGDSAKVIGQWGAWPGDSMPFGKRGAPFSGWQISYRKPAATV